MRIILVEDEERLAEIVASGLTKKGYAVDVVNRGDKAFERISLNHIDYDLVILDLMLPGMDGLDICRSLRELNITIPILILTARDEVDTKVELLLSGADDYLVKPFAFDELCARIKAVTRRPKGMTPSSIIFGDVVMDTRDRKVSKAGKEIPLTLKEFSLLEYFLKNPGKVINREELLSHLWDFNYSSFSNVVDVHVKNLRKKLDWEGSKNVLETVRGIGYRLKE